VAFCEDYTRNRKDHSAANLAVLRKITLNLIRLEPIEKYEKQKFSLGRKRLYASKTLISCSKFYSIYNAVALCDYKKYIFVQRETTFFLQFLHFPKNRLSRSMGATYHMR